MKANGGGKERKRKRAQETGVEGRENKKENWPKRPKPSQSYAHNYPNRTELDK